MNPKQDFFADEETDMVNDMSRSFSTGQRVGFGFLNILLGLGSFIMGDWKAGGSIIILEIASFGCIYGGIYFLNKITSFWEDKEHWGLEGFILAPIYGFVSLGYGILGFPLLIAGISFAVSSLVLSFIFPARYGKPAEQRELKKDAFDWRNLSFNLLCNEQGRIGGQIVYTAKF